MLRALILGGGVAGLTTALAARQAGVECVVLEARERDHPPPRSVHVHRLSSAAVDAIRTLAPGVLATSGPLPPIITLANLERRLTEAAVGAGVEVRFGTAASAALVHGAGWRLGDTCGRVHDVDLLIDATGGHRALLTLLDAILPDIAMDELGGAESYVSWTGQIDEGPEGLIAWDDRDGSLDGLIQFGPEGGAALTCRHRAGQPAPSLAEVMDAAQRATAPDIASRMRGLGFEGRGFRYTSPGVQRIALEEVDRSHLPPFALVGDALILAPPRFGEGLQRATEHALVVRNALLAREVDQLGTRLAEDAGRAWAGNGLALACRSLS